MPVTDEESRIVALKYKSQQVGKVAPENLLMVVKSLILRIHVITGWKIPENEMMNVLIDQFSKKLVEDYETLNPDEIEYAFRKSGTGVKDWGKAMNLNLIDEVLQPYVSARIEISMNEERRKNPPLQKIYSDEEILNERRGQIEMAYQAMRRGKLPIIHDYFAEVLMKDEFILDEIHLTDFFVHSLNSGREKIYEQA